MSHCLAVVSRAALELKTIQRVSGPAGALLGWSAGALLLGALIAWASPVG